MIYAKCNQSQALDPDPNLEPQTNPTNLEVEVKSLSRALEKESTEEWVLIIRKNALSQGEYERDARSETPREEDQRHATKCSTKERRQVFDP